MTVDLIKAILIGCVLIAALLVIPLILPFIFFAVIVGIIWFVLKMIAHVDEEEDKPP